MIKNDKHILNSRKPQGGFTIVELMIATMVFSVIMLVAAGTVVRFTNNFQKGLTQTATQNAARGTMDIISQQLQFIGDGNGFRRDLVSTTGNSKGYCIQGTRYSYLLGRQLPDQAQRVLVEQNGTGDGCGGAAQDLSASGATGKELLGPHMRLAKFDIKNDADADSVGDGSVNPSLYKITIKVVYGDDDLLCVSDVSDGSAKDCRSETPLTNVAALSEGELAKLQCKSQNGSQFCAVSDLSATVQRRV